MKQAQLIDGPSLIEFVVEQHDMVYPMVPSGADLHNMIHRPYDNNSVILKEVKEEAVK